MADGGAPSSAGTRDTRVDRPSEGLPGLATVDNPTANPPTRANLELGQAVAAGKGAGDLGPVAQVDTSGTSGLAQADDVKRAKPSAYA